MRHVTNGFIPGRLAGSNVSAPPFQTTAPSLPLAACADGFTYDMRDALWFNDHVGPSADMARQRARDICRNCAEQEPCLAFALREQIPHGIWGGLDPMERRRLARRTR